MIKKILIDMTVLAQGTKTGIFRVAHELVMKLHAEHPPLVPDFGPARPRDRGAYKKELNN